MLIFNGIDLQQQFGTASNGMERFIVNAVTGRGIIAQETFRESVSGMHGSYVRGKRYPDRPMQISFTFVSSNSEEKRRGVEELSAIFLTEGEVPIVFKDDPNRTYYGMLDGSHDWEEIVYTGKGTINILCSDPFKYGEFRSLVGETSFTVGGTAPTPAFFTAVIDSNTTASIAEFTSGDKTLKLHYNFSATDVIKVDFEKEKVLINGAISNKTIDILYADFFKLKPGTNNIITSPAMRLDIEYTERWL